MPFPKDPLASIRSQLPRAGAAWQIITTILRGMYRTDPMLFWITALFGVAARFATLGQFVVVMRALLDALEGHLTAQRIGLYAAAILVASGVRLARLRVQRLYVGRFCRRAATVLRNRSEFKLYAGLKASVYGKAMRGFSIVEAVLFATTTGVALLWVSPALSVVLMSLCVLFLLLLVFLDMHRAAQKRLQRFSRNYRPLASAVRTDMAFNLVLLACAIFVQAEGGIELPAILAIALVFLIRYLVVYMREFQRSVVYMLDLASRQDIFVRYFSFQEKA